VAAGFAAAPAAAQSADPSAAAKVVASGSDKIKLTLSGQINRQMQVVDDGFDTEVKHTDNQLTGSRFRIGGSGKINADMSVGTMIEMGIIPNSGGVTNQDAAGTNINSGAGSTHEARVVDIFFTSTKFGRVYMGKGSGGSDGSGEITNNMMGAIMQTGDMTHAIGGGFLFKNNGVDIGAAPGRAALTMANTLADYDGMSRVNRVRYDTPTFMGIQGRATHADQGDWDVSLWHDATYFGFKVGAAIAYSEQPNQTANASMTNGSISVMSPWGISVGYAAGRQVLESTPTVNRVANYWGATVSYETQFNELGKTGVGYTYTSHNGDATTDSSATGHQVAIVQNIDAAATELYISWARASVDFDSAGAGTGGQYKDLDSYLIGSRVRF